MELGRTLLSLVVQVVVQHSEDEGSRRSITQKHNQRKNKPLLFSKLCCLFRFPFLTRAHKELDKHSLFGCVHMNSECQTQPFVSDLIKTEQYC